MISVQIHITDLHDRMDTAVRLVDETHPSGPSGATAPGPISREARGLAIVLLFAAYENLLKSLTRTLLEGAIKCRVGNRRLQPGFRTFALTGATQSARERPKKEMYSHILPKLVDVASAKGSACTINPNAFPDDGSFMKRSQIELWCKVFSVGPPPAILKRTWTAINTIVSERNAIAHGQRTPDEIGRGYTENDLRKLIDDWRDDWSDFLLHVEKLGSSRDFFRLP